jgi:hypothetical protein
MPPVQVDEELGNAITNEDAFTGHTRDTDTAS